MTDPLDEILAQAQVDAVRAALRPANTPNEVADVVADVRAVLEWLEREHGAEVFRDFAAQAIFDLAEAFEVIAGHEETDAHHVLDGWHHDIPAPPEP